MSRPAKLVLAAEEEFGEPFPDILQGFADMGYCRAQTARVLGYNHESTLRIYEKRKGIRINWPDYRNDMYREDQAKLTKENGTAQRLAEWRKSHYAVNHKGRKATIPEIAKENGLSASCLRERIKKDPDAGFDYWLRPKHANRPKGRGRIPKDHPWRKEWQTKQIEQDAQGK